MKILRSRDQNDSLIRHIREYLLQNDISPQSLRYGRKRSTGGYTVGPIRSDVLARLHTILRAVRARLPEVTAGEVADTLSHLVNQ